MDPGTDDDGFLQPEWRATRSERIWYGGVGDWSYIGCPDEDAEVGYAFRIGADEVQRQREFIQERMRQLNDLS